MQESLLYQLATEEQEELLEESLWESDSPFEHPRKKPVFDKKRKSRNRMKKRSKQINRRKS